LHGGTERETEWHKISDTFGADPALRNHFSFYDMTPHEMQEDLWKRINVLKKKHQHLFDKSYITAPYVDWMGYF